MAKKGFTPEQIINKLREAEILLSQGETITVISKKLGVSIYTYYRWRKEYGGMRVEQARRLKELEQENSQLKKLVADLSLDNAILKEAIRAFIEYYNYQRYHEGLGDVTPYDVYTGRHLEVIQRRKEAKNRALQARREYNRTAREQGSDPSSVR